MLVDGDAVRMTDLERMLQELEQLPQPPEWPETQVQVTERKRRQWDAELS